MNLYKWPLFTFRFLNLWWHLLRIQWRFSFLVDLHINSCVGVPKYTNERESKFMYVDVCVMNTSTLNSRRTGNRVYDGVPEKKHQ